VYFGGELVILIYKYRGFADVFIVDNFKGDLMQVSVMLSNLGLPFDEALDTVQSLGIPAVQVSISREHDAQERGRMMKAIAARGLKVSAICVDAGDLGESEKADASVEAVKPFLDIAAEIGNGICQTHVGIMPYNMQGPRWDSFVRSCSALAQHGEAVGACLAMETGPEPPRVMEGLIRAVGSTALRVNYDPANFIIWPAVLPKFPEYEKQTEVAAKPYNRDEAITEFEPVEGVRRLGEFIVHTHAKDARGEGGWGDVPLGEGWVDWPRYLRLHKESGYDGYLAIEREAGDDRVGENGRAAEFLKEHLRQLDQN
jgi:sugar phosphate isomerase/epimerase